MSDLTEQHCVPCEGGVAPLSKDDAQETMKHIPGWVLSEKGTQIARDFLFKDFVAAMTFVNKVAEVAEREGHHPDITVRFNKVHLELSTHAIGGLSTNDFILASQINAIAPPT